MKKIYVAIFCLGLLFYGVSFAAIQKIRFATEATYPPFEYIDASAQLKGFDIDIAKALCQEMKVECNFSNQSFSSLIPSLNLGKFDALIAALGVTPERQKQVAFTNSYYQPSASFVAAIERHYSISSLIGKTIGVQAGSTFEKYLNEKYAAKVTIKTYASVQDAFLDLVSGRIDAVLADTPIAHDWLEQNTNYKSYQMLGEPIKDQKYFGSGYGIAVRKTDKELLQALNKALATIKSNGIYDILVKKYFGSTDCC